MRSILAVFFLLFASRLVTADENQSGLIAVVARFLDISELPDPCDKPIIGTDGLERICISMDALYEAKYEVLEVLYGTPSSSVLTFRIADHYGYPNFALYKEALIFVQQAEDGPYLEKYQGVPVFLTTGGQWAMCGNPYNENIPEEERKIRNVDFGPTAIFADLSLFNAKAAAKEFDARYYELVGNHVFCRKGVYVNDLFDMKKNGVLKARGILLDP